MSHTDVSFYYGYPTHDEDLDSGGGGTICPADIYLVPPSPSDYEDFSATLDDDPLDVWASGTPIDLLPNELLLEIWEASGCNPVVLSWVCHRWREVAISAPGLWTGPSNALCGSIFGSTRYTTKQTGCTRR
ncbi:hypothetical protein OE88DRAFT_1663385 [Heliocybe sulcata]|uniref:F-box domain-containing protein n=1 Tax=Heliocybe sulcata TaxID=5364 RepID=A0A5C3MU71_9AGAM|nr:hypothetical protein OE88DRAFT_1663385 [Heliocybe sulcata]